MKANKVAELDGKQEQKQYMMQQQNQQTAYMKETIKIKVEQWNLQQQQNPKEEGQGDDAKQITAGLETDKEKVKEATSQLEQTHGGPRTNIQEGLQKQINYQTHQQIKYKKQLQY